MEWTADVAAGDWLRERVDGVRAGTVHSVVPRGFPAYVRIFHPAFRDRPVGRAWPPLPYASHPREWAEFQRAAPDVDTEHVSWATTAAAFGTTMHATAQWHRIVGPSEVQGEDGPRDATGWRYADPPRGDLDPAVLSAVAGLLAEHTHAPDDGFVAVWAGWGGLVGHVGYGASRVFFGAGDTAPPARHGDFLRHAARDSFNDVFRKPSWQPGVLPDDVSRGPRLELPDREHVLFRGGAAELADPRWFRRAPWRDRTLEEQGFSPTAQSPSIVWPEDRAWVLVTEVDLDSTVVAGSAALVRAIVADPRIEAAPIREGTSLSDDSDEVNR